MFNFNFNFVPTITVNDVINLQHTTTPQILPPPTFNYIPHFEIPKAGLHPDFCKLIPTPDRQLINLPPFHYDVHNPTGQPIHLIFLKNAYNDVATRVFDGSVGFNHPLEPFIQSKVLEILDDKIQQHCFPK